MEKKNIESYIVDGYLIEEDKENGKYYINFRDYYGKHIKSEISKGVFDEYMIDKKIYKKMENEFDRHIEHSQLTETTLFNRASDNTYNLEDEVLKAIDIKKLLKAMNALSEKQKIRVELHICNNITIRDLAKIENVRKNQIEKSIKIAIKNIKKFLKTRGDKI